MKDIKKIVWGAILIAAAVIFALNALNVTNIDLLFPGWWTLFIIVPCGVGVLTDRDKSGNIIGLLVGVSLLLWQLDLLDLSRVWQLIVVAVLVVIGIKLIVGGTGRRREETVHVNIDLSGDIPAGTAIFGGKDMNFDGQVFEGCELTAIFGGVQCDLRGAIIEKDCCIKASAIFGGIDILMPRGVNVKLNSTNVFGGTDDKCDRIPDAPVTVYIETASVFGGVDIK